MKTNKTVLKRVRITKNGKVKVRGKGQDHFNAKEGGRRQMSKNRQQNLVVTNKTASRYFY